MSKGCGPKQNGRGWDSNHSVCVEVYMPANPEDRIELRSFVQLRTTEQPQPKRQRDFYMQFSYVSAQSSHLRGITQTKSKFA